MSSDETHNFRTFAVSKTSNVTMNKTEQQKEATRFSIEYLHYLLQQEDVIERLLDKRMTQLEPLIEQMISEKVSQQVDKLLNNHH